MLVMRRAFCARTPCLFLRDWIYFTSRTSMAHPRRLPARNCGVGKHLDIAHKAFLGNCTTRGACVQYVKGPVLRACAVEMHLRIARDPLHATLLKENAVLQDVDKFARMRWRAPPQHAHGGRTRILFCEHLQKNTEGALAHPAPATAFTLIIETVFVEI